MNTNIFYFSGTGNSYVMAKGLAEKLKADLISIPKVMNESKIKIDADRIGIIFPSYLAPLAGMPLMVEHFIQKIENIESIQIFAVCTCGGYECVNAIPSLTRLKRIIKACGGELTEEYSTRLPMNNLEYDHIPIPISKDQAVVIRNGKKKMEAISRRILKKKGTKNPFLKRLFYLCMVPLYKMIRKPVINDLIKKAKEPKNTTLTYAELMPLTDKSITVSDTCTGCGICASVCPAKNIKIVNWKPEFQHRCEICFACDEWCPTKAIQHWSRAEGVKYHHPDLKLTDMN